VLRDFDAVIFFQHPAHRDTLIVYRGHGHGAGGLALAVPYRVIVL
jgi:hypothetical protein